MTPRHREMTTGTSVGRVAWAAGLAAGAAIAFAASASAIPFDPDKPGPGQAPVPVADGAPAPDAPPAAAPSYRDAARGILAQAGQDGAGAFGLPEFTPNTQSELLLGQTASPATPGAPAASTPYPNPINNAYLLPQNVKPAAPGEGQMFNVDPGQEHADLSRLDMLKQWHAMYQDGRLKGALLTRGPKEALGEPIPGTAPPPGTVIPGLGNGLPDPADAPAPGAPVPGAATPGAHPAGAAAPDTPAPGGPVATAPVAPVVPPPA